MMIEKIGNGKNGDYESFKVDTLWARIKFRIRYWFNRKNIDLKNKSHYTQINEEGEFSMLDEWVSIQKKHSKKQLCTVYRTSLCNGVCTGCAFLQQAI